MPHQSYKLLIELHLNPTYSFLLGKWTLPHNFSGAMKLRLEQRNALIWKRKIISNCYTDLPGLSHSFTEKNFSRRLRVKESSYI